jgi:predicted AlkP superfamily pyrophosphatase or phosphodiesterase
MKLLALVLTLAACHHTAVPASAPARGPIKRVVLVTVDGLIPDSYLNPDAHGLQVPTLRRIVRDGAYAEGAQSVLPSVTYPSHTSIATGVLPGRHGIVSNRPFDPLQQNDDGWYWYAEDIAAPTLWSEARKAGLHTALINWPVTIGAEADWLIPEYPVRQPDQLKLLRALSTPNFLAPALREQPELATRLLQPNDAARVDLAAYALDMGRPELMLLHISQVDGAQHHDGLWSPRALAAIENADAQLGRLLALVERAGLASETALVVASDHGFAAVNRQVHPNALLREAGLITVDAEGKPTDYRAASNVNGGIAYVYARDEATAAQALALFTPRAGQPGSGIARLYSRDELRARGGDAAAAFALEAEPGVHLGGGLASYETAPSMFGMHGYDPQRPEMLASLLWLGPGIQPGPRQGVRLIDIAPTVAAWLGFALPSAEGRALD